MCVIWLFPLEKWSLNAQRWIASLTIYLLERNFKGSTGRQSACFTEATYPNLRRSAEIGQTRNSSWYLKQFSQKNSYRTTWKQSSRPVELRNSKQMLLSPANFLSLFFLPALLRSSGLFYIRTQDALAHRREDLTPALVINIGWISIWSIPPLVGFY